MPTVAALGTNYNLPQYHGRVHQLTPSDTPFFTALVGTADGGGEIEASRTFEWQTFDLRAAGQNTVPDGDRTGTPEHRSRSNVFNVLQTHREDVDVAYERLAQVSQFSGQNISGSNPITDEEAWQIEQKWKEIKRDIEHSLINGVYQLPVDNTTAAQTRGILAAITSNVVTVDGGAGARRAVTEEDLGDAMQEAWDNGGLQESEMGLLICNSVQKRWITKVYVKDKGLETRSRNVGGANVTVVDTDFGSLGIMLNRYMPQDVIACVSLDQCKPHFRAIPEKGVMFAEPTAKAGASNASQLYASVGLEYGNEAAHAKITNLLLTAPTG